VSIPRRPPGFSGQTLGRSDGVCCTRPLPRAVTLEEGVENTPLGRRGRRGKGVGPRSRDSAVGWAGAASEPLPPDVRERELSGVGRSGAGVGPWRARRWVRRVEGVGSRSRALGGGRWVDGGGPAAEAYLLLHTAGYVPTGGIAGGRRAVARGKAGAETHPAPPGRRRFHSMTVPKTYRTGSGRRCGVTLQPWRAARARVISSAASGGDGEVPGRRRRGMGGDDADGEAPQAISGFPGDDEVENHKVPAVPTSLAVSRGASGEQLRFSTQVRPDFDVGRRANRCTPKSRGIRFGGYIRRKGYR
jgi:hypothetical protein